MYSNCPSCVNDGDILVYAPYLLTLTIIVSIIAIAVYIYTSWATMTIARRTKTPHAWLAWIPIANIYLLIQIAKLPWWWFLVALALTLLSPLNTIGIIFSLALLGLSIWWWWRIAENRNKPGWWGLMVALIPLVNLVFIGLIAWTLDSPKKENK